MGDEAGGGAAKKEINVFKYIEQRVATTFPALVGPKFTAKYATEQNEYVHICSFVVMMSSMCDFDHAALLVLCLV